MRVRRRHPRDDMHEGDVQASALLRYADAAGLRQGNRSGGVQPRELEVKRKASEREEEDVRL